MYGVSPGFNVANVCGFSIFYFPSVFFQVYLYIVNQGSLNHTVNNSLQFVKALITWLMIHYIIILEKQRIPVVWDKIHFFAAWYNTFERGVWNNCVRRMKYTKPHIWRKVSVRFLVKDQLPVVSNESSECLMTTCWKAKASDLSSFPIFLVVFKALIHIRKQTTP